MKPAQERLEKMLTMLDMAIEALKTTPGARESERYYYEILRNFYRNIYNNYLSGEPIVHTGIFAPQELFKAMGIAPYSPEFDALLTIMMNPEEGMRFIMAFPSATPGRIRLAWQVGAFEMSGCRPWAAVPRVARRHPIVCPRFGLRG